MSASHLKKHFRRCESGALSKVPMLLEYGNGDDEHTSLLHRVDTITEESRSDPQWWVRIPSSTIHTFTEICLSDYFNILLPVISVTIAAGALGWHPAAVLVLNLLSLWPLKVTMNFVLKECLLALSSSAATGALGALINGLIVSIIPIILLIHSEISLIKSFILGTVLFALACELGGGVLADGIRSNTYFATPPVTLMLSSAGLLALGLLFVPITFTGLQKQENASIGPITELSRGVAFILLIVYLTRLFFQLKSNAELFEDSATVEDSSAGATISSPAAILALLVTVALYAVCGRYLVSSIVTVTETQKISKGFIGFILLPIACNAPESITGFIVASKNRLDLILGVIFGSILEVVCFATPLLVILGWIIKAPMSLDFEFHQVVSVAPLAIIICLTLQNGQLYYLHGVILIGIYIAAALSS